MRQNRNLTLIAFSVVLLFLIAACGKGGDIVGGAPTTPFIGGTDGLEISFLEGNPPEEVTDKDTFDFQAVVKLVNNGEFDLEGDDVKVSLIGFSASDFRSEDDPEFTDDKLIEINPDDELTSKKKDSEGNIIDPIETFVTFPTEEASFNFKKSIGGNTPFIFRADVCYKYETKAISEICILENLVDARDDAICDPSETKTIFSSGSPVQLNSFRQSVAGRNKIQFSFDIVHSGQGTLFKPGGEDNPIDCPKDSSQRRKVENRVNVIISTGLDNTPEDAAVPTPSLKCVGLGPADNGEDVTDVTGVLTLIDGKRTVTCTLNLGEERTDFKKSINIDVGFNYRDIVDQEILVKRLADD